jgi:hypothetical protein
MKGSPVRFRASALSLSEVFSLGKPCTKRGRPANGYFTKRLAEDWLRETLDQARRDVLPGMVRTGATFADAAAEWLR